MQNELGGICMKTIRINLSDTQYEKLEEMAAKKGQTIQNLIRSRFFNEDKTIFTPEIAVKRIQNGAVEGMAIFTLPDVYGDEWTLDKGPAGAFGKAFYDYITLRPECNIRYKAHGSDGRRAEYYIENATKDLE